MRALLLLSILFAGCGWKPKPYVRDPMGKLPLLTPEAATVEPLVPAWPAAPEPPTP